MNHHLCKNCQHTFEGNFCSNCGQKTNTTRLNWHFVKEELQYTFLHINKGLLYTAKQLFTKPGETIRDYIDGKRVQHYKPILLVFVLAGLSGLLTHYIGIDKLMPVADSNVKMKSGFTFGKESFEWMLTHYAIIELGLVPIISLCSYLAFKKWGYNYIENIIINCFASGQRLLFGIAVFPIMYFASSSKYFMTISTFLSLPTYLLTVWTYYKIYDKKVVGDFILRFLFFAFLFGLFFVLAIIIAIIVVVLLTKSHYLNLH